MTIEVPAAELRALAATLQTGSGWALDAGGRLDAPVDVGGVVQSFAVPALAPDDPTDRALEEMYVQPGTGPAAGRRAAVAAGLPRLVEGGHVPHPGSSLDGGLGSRSADAYVGSLDAGQRDV